LDKATYVIDNVLDFTAQDPFEGNKILVEATAKSAAAHHVAKTYIYTSGTLIYPHSEEIRDENSPLSGDFPITKGRIAFERYVQTHTGLRGIVIRPGFVYGGQGISFGAGNQLARFFEDGTKDKIVINSKCILISNLKL